MRYEAPEMEIFKLSIEDVITGSLDGGDDNILNPDVPGSGEGDGGSDLGGWS